MQSFDGVENVHQFLYICSMSAFDFFLFDLENVKQFYLRCIVVQSLYQEDCHIIIVKSVKFLKFVLSVLIGRYLRRVSLIAV